MFRAVFPSIIRSLKLYIQHHTIQVLWLLASKQPQKLYDVYLILPAVVINPLNPELNPICHLLALLGAHHILHVSRIRINRTTDFYSKINHKHSISNLFYCGTTFSMFRTVSPSVIRSLRLYTQHQVYVIQVLWLLASSHRTCMTYT